MSLRAISVKGGTLYQWDIGRKVVIDLPYGIEIDEVHFSHGDLESAAVVRVYDEKEEKIADIPNNMLQKAFAIKAYLVNNDQTVCCSFLNVIPRAKPDDYVYTETEVRNYEALEERIKTLEENGTGGGGGIAKETDPTVPQWAKERTKPSYTADEVGAPSKEEFDKLSEDIEDLKKNGTGSVSDEQIAEAVENYLTENPVEADLPTVSEADNGKALIVVGGEWKAEELPKLTYSEITNSANGTTVIIGE